MLFIIAKVVFMLSCHTGHEFAFSDMWDVILHGLTLDLSTALYIIILPFLLTIVSIWHTGKWISTALRIYFGIIALALALALLQIPVFTPSGDSSSMPPACNT